MVGDDDWDRAGSLDAAEPHMQTLKAGSLGMPSLHPRRGLVSPQGLHYVRGTMHLLTKRLNVRSTTVTLRDCTHPHYLERWLLNIPSSWLSSLQERLR